MPPHIPANHRSQATNRVSCHASHRCQQMKDNKLYNLPCFTRIPAKRKQHIVHLAMPHTDISQAEETKRKSYHASHRYQQITGNKSYILPCLTHRPANHKQQIVLASQIHQQISTTNQKSRATHRTCRLPSYMYQQITDNTSFILPCLIQITANHRKQIVYLAMPPQIPANYRQSYILPCLTQIPTNHRQQITRLANASHRYLQITGAKIVHLA